MESFHSLGTSISRIPDLTLPQFRLLLFLQEHQTGTINEIAASLGIAQSTASELVTRMVKAGLVVRDIHPQDRRVMQVKLSQRARDLLRQSEAALETSFRQLLSHMSAEEREAFVQSFETIARLLKE